jgi:hypothetical protein
VTHRTRRLLGSAPFRMSITRTEAELQTAIETMFRVRAVESPPDEQGARTIWHRGLKGADLVTWVDAFGRVTRQELYLFDDCLVWEKTSGVRTGETQEREGSKASPSPDTIAFDDGADDGRIVRARKALGPYSGADKFILHARQLVGGEQIAEEEITRSAQAISEQDAEAARLAHAKRSAIASAKKMRLVAVAVGLFLIAMALGIWVFELLP